MSQTRASGYNHKSTITLGGGHAFPASTIGFSSVLHVLRSFDRCHLCFDRACSCMSKFLTMLLQDILKRNESYNRSQFLHLNLVKGTFLVGLVFDHIRQEFSTLGTQFCQYNISCPFNLILSRRSQCGNTLEKIRCTLMHWC